MAQTTKPTVPGKPASAVPGTAKMPAPVELAAVSPTIKTEAPPSTVKLPAVSPEAPGAPSIRTVTTRGPVSDSVGFLDILLAGMAAAIIVVACVVLVM